MSLYVGPSTALSSAPANLKALSHTCSAGLTYNLQNPYNVQKYLVPTEVEPGCGSCYRYKVPSIWDLRGQLAFIQGNATTGADLSTVTRSLPGLEWVSARDWASLGCRDERNAGLDPKERHLLWERTA